jgi:hypothetical protein
VSSAHAELQFANVCSSPQHTFGYTHIAPTIEGFQFLIGLSSFQPSRQIVPSCPPRFSFNSLTAFHQFSCPLSKMPAPLQRVSIPHWPFILSTRVLLGAVRQSSQVSIPHWPFILSTFAADIIADDQEAVI